MLALLVAVLTALAPCWEPPVVAPVTDPFRLPSCTYCPGNRGIEYAPSAGQPVTAVEGGAVTFVGVVAGTLYVVVEHTDGIRATYGRLAAAAVHRGSLVTPGQRIGTTGDAFYFGLRDGDRPVDPTPMLGRRRFPVRLVPTDGSAGWPVGRGRLVCPNVDARR
jgi:murein DD-endopeptidase MepM/ murein hydrolase activator NlpD